MKPSQTMRYDGNSLNSVFLNALATRWRLCGLCRIFQLLRVMALMSLLLLLLLAALPVQAADYVFSATSSSLPPSCAYINSGNSSGNYTCAYLTLVSGDTVTFEPSAPTSPVTINVVGTFTATNASANASGLASNLNIVVVGTVAVTNALVNANVSSLAAVNITGGVGGNLSATSSTGVITLGANATVAGFISTDAGAINVGVGSVIGGSVGSTAAGVVTLGANVTVGGDLSTVAGAITIGDGSAICGSVFSTGAGVVTLGANIKVGGDLSTLAGSITVGAGGRVGGSVIVTGAGVVTLTNSNVGGNITTIAGAITLTDAQVGGSVAASGAGVVTLTNSVVNDACLFISPVCASPPVAINYAAFDCLESASNTPWVASARRPLYTKLAGTPFVFDVVALNADGSIKTNHVAVACTGNNATTSNVTVKNVTVELVEGAGNIDCASRATISPALSQILNVATATTWRKPTTSMAVNKAYANVRCRVTDASQSPNVVACSSDNFAVRPQSFTVSSSTVNADNTGVSATALPMIKAGALFSLSADTATIGYNGLPILNANFVAAHLGAITTGALSGAFSAAEAATGIATGNRFSYSEVGYFRFDMYALTDSSFTAVDEVNNDCMNDAPNEFSNTLNAGKYGCKFGNTTATSYFGRFIADHFDVVVAQGCSAGGFTYSGQPLTVTVTAKNGLAPATTTLNYQDLATSGFATSGFAKIAMFYEANAVAGGSLAPNIIDASAFLLGEAKLTPAFSFFNTATAPVTIKLRVIDADNVSSAGNLSGYESAATAIIKSGRVRLLNSFGSELLDLPMSMTAQYWKDASSGWQPNTADSCTNASLSFYAVAAPDITANTCVWDSGTPGHSGKGCSSAAVTLKQYKELGVTGFAGDFNLWLKAPGFGHSGSIDVMVMLPAWLQYNWTGLRGNPKARATFGVYKSRSNTIIHRREMY